MRTAAASLAAVSVLLSLATKPCSGRTYLRGSLMGADPESNRKLDDGGGKRNLRGTGGRKGHQQQAERGQTAGKKRGGVRGAGSSGSRGQHQAQQAGDGGEVKTSEKVGSGRKLQSSSSSSSLDGSAAPVDTNPALPECASLFVPALAGADLTGTYTFRGRYNDRRPVYASEGGNHFFSVSAGAGGGGGTSWYITQPESLSTSSNYFLSLASDAFEPADLEGLQPWIKNNDPACQGCTAMLRMSCSASTTGAAAALPTPAPTAAAAALEGGNSTSESGSSTLSSSSASLVSSTPAPTAALSTSSGTTTAAGTFLTGSCASLNIKNGADRAGTYALVSSGDEVVFRNERPSYAAVGLNRTDEAFSTTMDVCAAGYGVVDAAWAEAVGDLPATATVQAVFLMYVAENVGPDAIIAATAANATSCEVPVWLVTSGGAEGLDAAAETTFLSVSRVEDPSQATSWAKFTPATGATRPTLVENFWVDVGCADADEVEEASSTLSRSLTSSSTGAGAAGASVNSTTLVAVGKESNGSRLLWSGVVGW